MASVVRRFLFIAAISASICISLVGYYRDGTIPLLELASRAYSYAGRAALVSSTVSLTPSPSPVAFCNCTQSGDSSTKFVSQETAVEKLVPLSRLKNRIDFSQHEGLSLLDHQAMNRYYLCAPHSRPTHPLERTTECKKKRFLDPKSPIVALVSSPGSGNTWLRYLLEQASGVFTGSIYCDHSLKSLFPGEHVVSGGVLVVKTHRCESRELPGDVQGSVGRREYDRTVVLVRDPYDALVSEANRRWNSRKNIDDHVGLANERAFIGNAHWDWYVEAKSNSWAYLLHTWLSHTHRPTHVVQYEALVSNTKQELNKVLTFLEVAVDNQTLDCAIDNGNFKRTNHLNFDPFSRENKDVVNHVLKQVTPILSRYGITYKRR